MFLFLAEKSFVNEVVFILITQGFTKLIVKKCFFCEILYLQDSLSNVECELLQAYKASLQDARFGKCLILFKKNFFLYIAVINLLNCYIVLSTLGITSN